jgi:L-amino acid N-acyltransferase YncA
MESRLHIRPVALEDAKAALEVYKPFVTDTAISFEYEVPSVEDFTERIRTNTEHYPWLVCTDGDKIAGYAYGSRHRYRTAYQWSVESTIYISADYHRRGLARILYEALLGMLKLQGYVNVYAGVSLPNEKSEKFHKAMGFSEIGVFTKIGFKLGKWHDGKWFQLHLDAHTENPPGPKTLEEVRSTPEFLALLETANRQLHDQNKAAR